MKHRTRWIAAGVGVLLIALIAVLAFGSDDRLRPGSDILGQRVPAVAGPTLTGGEFDIDDARGKWVVVNFFATWCGPCVVEHPELVSFDEWASATGEAELVSVVFNDPVEQVETFFDTNGGDWPVLDDPSVPVDFGVAQIPETFLVAPNGQVVQHIQGGVEAEPLIALIEGTS